MGDQYPYAEGDCIVLGPEIFASKDGSVLNWKGENYELQRMQQLGADARQRQGRVEHAGALLERLLVAADRLLPQTPGSESGPDGAGNDVQVARFVEGGHESLRSVAEAIKATAAALDELNDYVEQRRRDETFADAFDVEAGELADRAKNLAASVTEGDEYGRLDRLGRRARAVAEHLRKGWDFPFDEELPQ
jgi:hypothetical protein